MKIKSIKILLVILTMIMGFSFSPSLSYAQSIKNDSSSKNKNVFMELNKNKHSSIYRKAKVTVDTLTSSKITKIWETNGQVHVEVTLVKKGVDITLKVYNMLGKEIRTIYTGPQTKDKDEYQFNSSELPNGIYICMLIGTTFRDTEKFIISR
ncbi:MAG: T9SS type A sorting domain-containing protein [bacterium]